MSGFLKAFSDFMGTREHHMHRVAEFRAGGEVACIQLSPALPCQNIYSVAKVFTVAAVGLLVDRGLLSTDDTVTEALGELCPDAFDSRWKETTVHMLLRHQVGLPESFMDIDSENAHTFGEDYLSYVMNHPLRAIMGQNTPTPMRHTTFCPVLWRIDPVCRWTTCSGEKCSIPWNSVTLPGAIVPGDMPLVRPGFTSALKT